MSIRSRIASFEAINEEVRRSTPGRDSGTTSNELMPTTATLVTESRKAEPRIVTPSSSVAGRFGSTHLQPLHRKTQPQVEETAPQITTLDDVIDEPPRVQRYQPLHQQYHQRQAQQRMQRMKHNMQSNPQTYTEQATRVLPPDELDSGEAPRAPSTIPTTRGGYSGHNNSVPTLSAKRRVVNQHQRKLDQLRRAEDSQRQMHENKALQDHHHHHQLQQQQHQRQTSLTNRDQTENHSLRAASSMEQGKMGKVTTAQRLAKIQRMQRNKNMDKGRKNHASSHFDEYEQQRPPSPTAAEVARDLSLQQSAADDEITLTSVRQIVGTTSANSSSSPHSSTGTRNKVRRRRPGEDPVGASLYPDEMTYTDNQDWQQEEKSDKISAPRRIRMSASSSSDEGADQRDVLPNIASQLTPDVASFFEESQRRFLHPNSPQAEEENASQGSESFAQRKERERLEKQAREAAVEKAKAEMEGPFIKAEDVDYYQKRMGTQVIHTTASVAVAATMGFVVLGPVGLLVGAAAVAIGVGIMQIPLEQRQNMEERATRTLRQVSDTALSTSESLSTACANTYQNSGLADHVPDEVNNCCAAIREVPTTDRSEMSVSVNHDGNKSGGVAPDHLAHDSAEDTQAPPRLPPRRAGAACLREGSFTPVNLIYTLNPVDQPRAWLDVLASAETTHDEKMEALEEIMILAKDKSRARILVEEGILDSIMWTLCRYFEKVYGVQSDDPQMAWAHPEITLQEAQAAKLSANCCLQLGKAYCAAMHTDGDLMLMSLYERGTVPEERQLAQMLHEVPYHARVTKTKDPTVIDPSTEVFAIVQMSLPQAEEFAKSVKALAHGNSYQMQW